MRGWWCDKGVPCKSGRNYVIKNNPWPLIAFFGGVCGRAVTTSNSKLALTLVLKKRPKATQKWAKTGGNAKYRLDIVNPVRARAQKTIKAFTYLVVKLLWSVYHLLEFNHWVIKMWKYFANFMVKTPFKTHHNLIYIYLLQLWFI